jgi:hypothetical protein
MSSMGSGHHIASKQKAFVRCDNGQLPLSKARRSADA